MTVWLSKGRRTYRYCFYWRGEKYVGNTRMESRQEADQVEATIRRKVISGSARRYPARIRQHLEVAERWQNLTFAPHEYAQLVFDQVRAESARRLSDGTIYFIGPAKPRTVKIGFATDINRRLPNLQIGSAAKLSVLAMFPGSRRIERYLHWAFADAAMTGEWFRRTDEIEHAVALFAGRDRQE